MRQKQRAWGLLLLGLCAFTLQGCFGIGDPAKTTIGTGSGGNTVSVVQNVFKGKIYATIGHNLYVIAGNGSAKQIVGGGNIYDPAISPDGTKIAFIKRFKQYSDLDEIAASGGQVRTLISGNGKFFPPNAGGFVHNSFHWYFEPAWSPDGSTLLFLSDWMKLDYAHQCTGQDTDLLDLQVFSMPWNDTAKLKPIAYASLAGGGDRDPSYRPGNANQIVYTHYSTIPSDDSKQVMQIMLADPRLVTQYPGKYCAGGADSGVAITNSKDQDIQPSYSPDGQSLVYIKAESATSGGIYVMSLPANVTQTPNDPVTTRQALLPYKHAVHLLSGTYLSRPIWSPDGKQIAYLVEGNEELDLWVINVSHNAQTGAYSLQGSAVQVTSGGIDGNSRFDWTS